MSNTIDNTLNIIDFSNGIRPEAIQENFEILDLQLQRERRNVGGPGISSGLEVSINVTETDFAVTVSSSSVVTNDGQEIFIPETKIDIAKPKLIQEKEYVNVDYNNQVTLKHIPYATNARTISQYAKTYLPEDTGISISYQDSAEQNVIKVTGIMKNTLTLSRLSRRDLEIVYNYSAKRIDTLYIDKNYNIRVVSGVTSTTPSAVIPQDFKYLIAFLEVDAHSIDANNRLYANIIFRKDLRTVRNIYTDSDGKLWICGTPFDSLQIIHMKEPASPKENTMWYDIYTNQIKIWRATDTLTYMNTYTVSTDYEDYPDAIKDFKTDMHYEVGGKQLSVYINDIKLSIENEYCEINELNLPVDKIDIEKGKMANTFRIFADLRLGDQVTYKIENFDKHYMWVPINNLSYINVKDTRMFSSNSEDGGVNYYATQKALALGLDEMRYPYKYQYFFFDADKEMNMLFTPHRKELDVTINQMPLHYDQFEEVTLYDLYDSNVPDSIATALAEHFGYTEQALSNLNAQYENIGIGFKLKDPLDVAYGEEVNGAIDLYVEASVTRRVNDSPFKRKLQRTATFVCEKEIQYTAQMDEGETMDVISRVDDNEFIITTDATYLYDENQIELFINGLKINKSEIIEGTDLSDEPIRADDQDPNSSIIGLAPRSKGARTQQLTLKRNLAYGDIVSYRITTNIYSYDHINDLLDSLEYDAKTATIKVEQLYNLTTDLQNEVAEQIQDMENTIQEIKDLSTDMDGKYMQKTDVLTDSQMPAWMITNTPKSLDHISYSLVYQGQESVDVSTKMREEDFIFCMKRNRTSGIDSFMIRDVDYRIVNVSDGVRESSILEFLIKPNTFDEIYFTGIKFNTAWRNS